MTLDTAAASDELSRADLPLPALPPAVVALQAQADALVSMTLALRASVEALAAGMRAGAARAATAQRNATAPAPGHVGSAFPGLGPTFGVAPRVPEPTDGDTERALERL